MASVGELAEEQHAKSPENTVPTGANDLQASSDHLGHTLTEPSAGPHAKLFALALCPRALQPWSLPAMALTRGRRWGTAGQTVEGLYRIHARFASFSALAKQLAKLLNVGSCSRRWVVDSHLATARLNLTNLVRRCCRETGYKEVARSIQHTPCYDYVE